MFEACQNFYFTQSPLTVGLMLEWRDFFNCNFTLVNVIESRSEMIKVYSRLSLHGCRRVSGNSMEVGTESDAK